MNNPRKLLAARRKLKEFQLNKGNHNQVTTTSQHLIRGQENSPDHDTRNGGSHLHETQTCENQDKNLINTSHSRNSSIQDLSNVTEDENPVVKTDENVSESTGHDLLDFKQNVDEAPNNTECESAIQNGDSKMVLENNAVHCSPVLRKDSTLSSVTSDNLNNNEYEIKSLTSNNIKLEHESNFINPHTYKDQQCVNQLTVQLNECKDKVAQLESCLAMKNAELKEKILEQVNPLREQIQFHIQTTNILVAEKAELSASLAQAQTVTQQKCNEVANLYEKLKYTQCRIDELEKEVHQSHSIAENFKTLHQQLENCNERLNDKCTELQKVNEEQKMEIAELRQELSIKSVDLTNISKSLEETRNSLSLAELKIQQLTNVPQEMQSSIESENQSQVLLEQELVQLKENLKSVTLEKEELCNHYDSYAKQVDAKYESAIKELKASQMLVDENKEREESFIQRLSMMEQQYQREKQKVESLLPLQEHDSQIKHLTQSMDSLVLEHETLQSTLREREAEIEMMKNELKELRELRDQSVETSKLVNALESEQLGASRAVSQNEQLKFQLSEMHDAFVALSNSKLNLTEQLQDERSVGRKLNKELNRIEDERDKLKEELTKKDEIMKELEKEKLQTAQIADQMHHYQAQSYQTTTLQQELQNVLKTVETLTEQNTKLAEELEMNASNHKNEAEVKGIDGNETESKNIKIEQCDNKETKETQIDPDDLMPEPLMKLEKRFKETIERVAELTDEKQRLEHLVLQLQGETETIGEYVTLYQKQRAILQMKAQDREQMFRQLIEQRNQQQTQLHQLKVLVADLLKHKNNEYNAINSNESNLHSYTNQNAIPGVTSQTLDEEITDVHETKNANETEAKILELLTEIKDCKDTCSLEPNFHPCLWCSGKLITV